MPIETRPDTELQEALAVLVVGYWFGSSHGSARKQDSLDRMATTAATTHADAQADAHAEAGSDDYTRRLEARLGYRPGPVPDPTRADDLSGPMYRTEHGEEA